MGAFLLSDPGQPCPLGPPHMLLLCSSVTQQNSCLVGEVVRVIDDLGHGEAPQAGHGEWTDDMAPCESPTPTSMPITLTPGRHAQDPTLSHSGSGPALGEC